MNRFDNLIKYLPLLEDDNFGTWIIDRENDGTPEHPIQMPFVNYSAMVHHFIEDVYVFVEENEDLELNHYYSILEQNGLEWGSKSMREAEAKHITPLFMRWQLLKTSPWIQLRQNRILLYWRDIIHIRLMD